MSTYVQTISWEGTGSMSSKWHLPEVVECCYTPELHVVFWWIQHGTFLAEISKVRHICRPAQVEIMLFFWLFFPQETLQEDEKVHLARYKRAAGPS